MSVPAREPQTTADLDPLAGMRVGLSDVAEIALGNMNFSESHVGAGRHLALLTAESLELDLSDPAQRRLGDYELLELIGEGGMGVVYRARQHGLDREVAVKLLAAGPWASKDFIERFRREAQNAARMQHPNIVTIYEVGSAEELHFFSMRLVLGGSLASLLRKETKLPALRAAQLLRTIAEAVDYAHRLGVLHLDLKPANVLLDADGIPHVADFGLARRLEQGLAAVNNEVSGTPSYMAPEQAIAGSQKISPATDIWGLGAVLYELVTGEPPFLGGSPHATLKMVVESELVSPRRREPKTPRDLEAIIFKCMTRDPAERYSSARAMADDLSRFIEGREVRARPLNGAQRVWRWARRDPKLAITALLAFAILLIGLSATTQQWQRAEQQRVLAENNSEVSHQLAWKSRRDAALRLETDGNGFDALPLLVDNIEEQEKARLPASRERLELGMILSHGVTLIDRMIIPEAHPVATALSPDGSLLAIGLDDVTVHWYDTATMTERGSIDLSDLPTSDGVPRVPQLLRFVDDHHLRVTLDWFSYLTSPPNLDTYLIDLDNAVPIVPPSTFADLADANFSSDGAYVLLSNKHGEMQTWQVDPWRPISAIDKSDHTIPWLIGKGAKFGLTSHENMKALVWFDPHHPEKKVDIDMPVRGSLTAWQEDGHGAQVAFGDNEGRVFVLDLATRRVKQLPTPFGTAVNWLAFSEDDAWLAAARADGTALAFDIASGTALHSGEMRNDFELRYAAISHRDRVLLVSGEGDVALWHLPQSGMDGVEAVHLLSSPTHSESGAIFWTGVSLSSGLLATADMDGEVRLWRLPQDSTLAALSPPHIPADLHFDGVHVVDVAYDKLRVASIGSAVPNAWTTLPHRIAFAELTANNTLVATAGNQVFVMDADSMKQRYAPIQVVAHPQRFAIDATGSVLLLSFGHNSKSGFEERLMIYDLKQGRLRPGDIVVKGPLRQMELSADASRVLTVGPNDGSTQVFDAFSEQRVGEYPHDTSQPVLWASFADQGGDVWLVTRSTDTTRENDADVLRWSPAQGIQREHRRVVGIKPIGITDVGNIPVLAAKDRVLLNPGAPPPDEHSSPRVHGGEATTVIAVSHNHKLIAHVYGRSVQLYDAATLEPVGAPLATNTQSLDLIANLAFSPDDRTLLGNAQGSRRWLVWPVAVDERGIEELRRDSERLAPLARGQHVLQIASAEERRRLRASDPGRRIEEVRPQTVASRMIDGVPVPARDPSLSSMMIDLTNYYNIAPESARPIVDTVLALAVSLPLGPTTLDGVDYDVRGGIEMRFAGVAAERKKRDVDASVPLPTLRGISMPQVPVAALHILLFAPLAVEISSEVEYCGIRLHYRDGSESWLPMRTQHETPGWTDHDRPVPVGWVFGDFLAREGYFRQSVFSNPRLANPHPERVIASIDLETSRQQWSEPVFFAITAEPVIPDSNSRTKEYDSPKAGPSRTAAAKP